MRFLRTIVLNPAIIITVIVLCFGCVILLLQYYDYNTKQLLVKNAEAQGLVARWEMLLSCTKDLIISNDLNTALYRWKKAIADFDRSLTNFIQSDVMRSLLHQDALLRNRVDDTKNLWEVMRPRIESVQIRFEEYLSQSNEKSEVSKRSLLHELLYQMEQNSRSTEYVQLFDLTYDIEYMVSSLSGYFLETMNMMVKILHTIMDAKTRQIWIMVYSSIMVIVAITILFLMINQRALNVTTSQLRYLSNQLMDAEEKERKRIAQELHDEIGQALTGIKFAVDNACNLISTGRIQESVQALDHVVSLIRTAIEEARRISVSLRPAIIDQLGIIATISWYCREYQKIYAGIKLYQHIEAEEKDIPNHLKIIIYRILQETLTNVAKHSNAEQVHVTLNCREGQLTLAVQDNGSGFKQQSGDDHRGFGLISLRERIELTGGTFTLRTVRGEGTRITACWEV